jgi:hypothetical protein
MAVNPGHAPLLIATNRLIEKPKIPASHSSIALLVPEQTSQGLLRIFAYVCWIAPVFNRVQ